MNTKQYAASSLLVALLITNTSPWIPLAMANPVIPNSSHLGPKMLILIHRMIKVYLITNMILLALIIMV